MSIWPTPGDEFSSFSHRVYDNLDHSKRIKWDLSGQDTGETITLTTGTRDVVFDDLQRNLLYTVYIESLGDFPDPIASVIYLADMTAYKIGTHVDIGANRLDSSGGTVGLIGNSSELSSITTSSSGALITSDDTVVARWITFTNTVGPALDMDADSPASGNPNPAIDWFGVNFLATAVVGMIKNYRNFIGFSTAFLSSGALTFDGTFGTIAFDTCLFSNPAVTSLLFASTLTINVRVRIQFSSFVTASGRTSISFDAGATIPDAQYNLFRCSFSGGSTTHLIGVSETDNTAFFEDNSGIENSRTVSDIHMNGNATVTTISLIDTWYKISGTTTANSYTQRFDNSTTNRCVYTGPDKQLFRTSAIISLTDGSNRTYDVGVAKNGVVQTDSIFEVTTSSGGRIDNMSTQYLTELTTGDYIELFIRNNTDDSDPTITHLSINITRVRY
jgi:hypothetical protein